MIIPSSRTAARCLLAVPLCLLGCSADSFGVQWVVLEPGETQTRASCVLLTDDGSSFGGQDLQPLTDSNYHLEQKAGGGGVAFRIFIRAEPGREAEQPRGQLVLEIELDNGNFGRGSARFGEFQTRDGATHQVYIWGTNDCETVADGPPHWVMEQTHD